MDSKQLLGRMKALRDSQQVQIKDLEKERDRLNIKIETLRETVADADEEIRQCEHAMDEADEENKDAK